MMRILHQREQFHRIAEHFPGLPHLLPQNRVAIPGKAETGFPSGIA
jgi:hypothetical protein